MDRQGKSVRLDGETIMIASPTIASHFRRGGYASKYAQPHAQASHRVNNPRIHRAEQTSANRWHLAIQLKRPDDIDAELRKWLSEAYDLAD